MSQRRSSISIRNPCERPRTWGKRFLLTSVFVLLGAISPLWADGLTPRRPVMPTIVAMPKSHPTPTSLPATTTSDPKMELTSDLILLAGQGDSDTRREAAVRILNSDLPEAGTSLIPVLETPGNISAKLAVCEAIVRSQRQLLSLVDSLIALTREKDLTLRQAALEALAVYRDPQVVARIQPIRQQQEKLLLADSFTAVATELVKLLPTETARTERVLLWLHSPVPAIRQTALRIVSDAMSEQKQPATEVLQQIRLMLADNDDTLRQSAVIILQKLRRPEDAPLLRARLQVESMPTVRQEIYRALGYLMDSESIAICTAGCREQPESVAAEAAAALGRLAARNNGKNNGPIGPAVDGLIERIHQPVFSILLREQIITAMAEIADPRFLPTLIQHAGNAENEPAIRQAAIRGIGRIGETAQVTLAFDLLHKDPDRGVREAAAEAIGELGGRVEHLEMLRTQLDSKNEPTAAVQTAVWTAYRKIFSRLSPADCRSCIEIWNKTNGETEKRLDLLGDLEQALSGTPSQQLAEVREMLGDLWQSSSQPANAAAAYARTLDALTIDRESDRARVAIKLINAHLQNAASDKALAAAAEIHQPDARNDAATRLLTFARNMAVKDPAATMTFLHTLKTRIPEQFGASWATQFNQLAANLTPPASAPSTTAAN